jgi:hypothetical protein
LSRGYHHWIRRWNGRFPRILDEIGEVGIGKDDDGRFGKITFRTDVLDDIHTGELREDEVEQNHAGLEGAHERQAGFAGGGAFNLIAFDGEFVAVNVPENLIVFDDKNFFHV